MGFLGTEAGLFSDISLIIVVTGFIILCLGSVYAKRKDFIKHIKLTNIAVLLGSLSFLWMAFSLISHFLISISVDLTGLLIASHVITGTLALFWGIFFTLDEVKKTKTTMRLVFLTWTIAIFLGILIYDIYYIH